MMLVALFGLLSYNFIMSSELFCPSPSSRLNPEFIGIAKKFSTQKEKRKSLQNERDEHLRTLKYKMSVDKNLSKGLEEQKGRLQQVKKIHQRRLDEEQFKRQQIELNKARLRSLSCSVKQAREDTKRSIRHAKLITFNRHRKSRQDEKHIQNLIENRIKKNTELNELTNKKRFSDVKRAERHSINTVDKFYRTLNKQSLKEYQQQISEECHRGNIYEQQIRVMESSIAKYDVSIENKKDKMMNIFCEIEDYTAESPLEQSKCLPLYLRPLNSATSSSSRPRDILMRQSKDLLHEGSMPNPEA